MPKRKIRGDVNQEKGSASIFTGDIWKTPDVSQSDCKSSRSEDKTETIGPLVFRHRVKDRKIGEIARVRFRERKGSG